MKKPTLAFLSCGVAIEVFLRGGELAELFLGYTGNTCFRQMISKAEDSPSISTKAISK